MLSHLILSALLASAAGCSTVGPVENRTEYPLPMLTRAEWQAADPVSAMKPHQPERITIHHTATRQNPDRSLGEKLRALQEFSQHEGRLGDGRIKPPWPDVPYHFYIDVHGSIGEGRDIRFAGDTNTEYDPTGHILIVLEGNFEEERPSEEQIKSLLALIRWLSANYEIPPDRIGGHKDYAWTACPGGNLESLLPKIRDSIEGKKGGF